MVQIQLDASLAERLKRPRPVNAGGFNRRRLHLMFRQPILQLPQSIGQCAEIARFALRQMLSRRTAAQLKAQTDQLVFCERHEVAGREPDNALRRRADSFCVKPMSTVSRIWICCGIQCFS